MIAPLLQRVEIMGQGDIAEPGIIWPMFGKAGVRIGAPANGDVHRPCEGGEHRGLKQRIVYLAIGRERENARRRRPDDGRPPSGHAPTCTACLYPPAPPGGTALCCFFRRRSEVRRVGKGWY